MLYKICTYLILALGIVHLSLTPFAYKRFTPDTLLFIGSGFAFIFAGFLNIAAMRSTTGDRTILTLCFLANTLLTALFAFGITIMPEPQVWLGTLFCIVLTAISGRELFAAKTL